MIPNEIKMRVAQNCPGYVSRNYYSLMSMLESSESCSNCKNWVRGRCVKELFDGIYETIRIN